MYFFETNDNHCAFVDETGSFGFNFQAQGNSSHYIITAVVIKRGEIESLRSNIDIIRSNFFGNGEMKSSSIASTHKRRFEILNEILKYNFKIFCLVVDKQKAYEQSKGLRYKKSFIKYLNNILYKELKLLYPSLEIFADSQGSDKFMNEFCEYVRKIPTYGLFDDFAFHFVDSKSEPLIQLADIIGGTISFGFEKSKMCEEYKGYYNLLKDRINALKMWPLTYESYLVNIDSIGVSEFDKNIAVYCLRLATKYIEECRNSKNSFNMDKVLVLEYLMNQIYSGNRNRYISAKELIKYINSVSKIHYNSQTFKTNIIASLRDNNVIISSSATGYKIPISKKELYSYTNITLGMVMPMLERLNKCRTRILSLTDNELDILNSEEHQKIKRYFDDVF